jgi:ATP-dependent RNA helicase DHX29
MLAIRTDLKVILMSATLNAETFADCRYLLRTAYDTLPRAIDFGNATIVDIEGRSFPVTPFFLEDVLDLTSYDIDPKSMYAIRDSDRKGHKQPAADEGIDRSMS